MTLGLVSSPRRVKRTRDLCRSAPLNARPASRLWRELSGAYPDALILLSVRDSPEQWWRSVDRTIFPRIRQARGFLASDGDVPPPDMPQGGTPEQRAAMGRMFLRISVDGFADVVDDKDAAMAWYERHLAEVRAEAPSGRLLEWRAGDGWPPLCEALGVPVPDEPFPNVNSSDEFQVQDWGSQRPE